VSRGEKKKGEARRGGKALSTRGSDTNGKINRQTPMEKRGDNQRKKKKKKRDIIL